MNSTVQKSFAWLVVGLGTAFALLIGFTPATVWYPIVLLTTGGVILLGAVYRYTEEEDRDLLMWAFIIALVIRAWCAWWIVDYDYRNPDSRMYWASAVNLAQLLFHSPRITPLNLIEVLGTHQQGYYITSAVLTQVQHNEIVICFVNVLIGMLIGLLVYRLTRQVWPEHPSVACTATLLTWFASSMITVSAANIRDAAVTAGGLIVMIAIQRLSTRWNWKNLFLYVIGLSFLIQFRSYIAFMLLPTSVLILLIVRRKHRMLMLGIFAGVVAIALIGVASMDLFIIADQLGEGVSFFDMLKIASAGLGERRQADSAVAGVSLNSWADLMIVIPLGYIRAFLSPLPWNPSYLDKTLIPGVILRYLIMPFAFIGAWEGMKRNWRRTFPMVTVWMAYMAVYALIEIGGNVRHNTQFYPLYFLFAAIGILVRSRYCVFTWVFYAALTVSLWTQALSLWLFKRFGAVVFALMAIWWIVETRAWEPVLKVFARRKAEDSYPEESR